MPNIHLCFQNYILNNSNNVNSTKIYVVANSNHNIYKCYEILCIKV